MGSKKTVWFNHWFSTAYHIINLLREGESGVRVIGSNRSGDSVMKLVCDEWYTEQDIMSDEDYLDFCVDFCREHRVDVFVPRRGMGIISRNAVRFEDTGTKLLLDTESGAVGIFADKLSTYEFLRDTVSECIPPHYEAASAGDFRAAYGEITRGYERACFKFAKDEGAVSFRVIDNTMGGSSGLYKAPGMKISYETAEEIMNAYDFKERLIVMPYLKGGEVSCDCLRTGRGDIVIPRYKSGSRLYTVKYDERLIGLCRRILSVSGLEMPCNIQFRYHDETPYLLEVNTRMSGGIQLSCLSAGVNIPNIAYNKLLGIEKEWNLNETPSPVSYIENPVIL